ncbi:hypothetical protein EDEG_00820 [Edhazardia aedis USNM 41457]|uniref:Uncharacterized protein n=1 Tax=Edhazardia aedis (strain USNM 41457) TaxID=1003232 RepID=J9DC21_EDHAE|nr:hypothetical protein EDEG_00820 [Edhazardia aedis USNM 41457]|eukprot:EJW05039.1 hypothetical protein EDEG_00820 [Edhazardia aedis USNM 41457]
MPKFNFLRLSTNVFLNIAPNTGTKPNPMGKDTSKVKSLFHQYHTTGIRCARQDNNYLNVFRIIKTSTKEWIVFYYGYIFKIVSKTNNNFGIQRATCDIIITLWYAALPHIIHSPKLSIKQHCGLVMLYFGLMTII